METQLSSEVKQVTSSTSRLAKIFGRRRKSQRQAPNDLATAKSVDSLSKRFSFSKRISITSQPEDVSWTTLYENEVSNAHIEDRNIKQIPPTYTKLEAVSPNFLAVLRPKAPNLLNDMEILSSIALREPYTSENSSDSTHIEHETTRTVYCDMVEAFAEALDKTRASKVETKVTVEHVPSTHKLSTIPQEADPQMSPAGMLQTRPNSRKNSGISRSLSSRGDRRVSFSKVIQADKCSIYAKMPLPDRPQSNDEARSNDISILARRPKVSRKELLRAKVSVTPPQLTTLLPRRGSCPVISTAPSQCKDGILAKLVPQAQSNVNHLLGLLFFLYWISAGRRFFDKEFVEILSKPNSRCLSLESVIVGFQTEFPEASLEVYMSNSKSITKDSSEGLYLKLPYANDTFDVVSALGLAMTVSAKDWPGTLAELRRIMKPGGKLELIAASSFSLNAGPTMRAQEAMFGQRLVEQGLLRDSFESIPSLVRQARFDRIEQAHLAIPIRWGGRVSHVWDKFYEPIRTFHEKQIACAWTIEQQEAVESEVASWRSSRGLILAVATK